MKVKFEYVKGTEKLIIEMDGTKRVIDYFQRKAQWILFKEGWTLKKTSVLGKKKMFKRHGTPECPI